MMKQEAKKNVMMLRIKETGSSRNQICKFTDLVWEGFLKSSEER